MSDQIAIRANDFAQVYRMATKAMENRERTEVGRLDRIRGMAILEALYSLGLVDEDNLPTDPAWIAPYTTPAR